MTDCQRDVIVFSQTQHMKERIPGHEYGVGAAGREAISGALMAPPSVAESDRGLANLVTWRR